MNPRADVVRVVEGAADETLLLRARVRARTRARALRRVPGWMAGDLDVYAYEDEATGERHVLPARAVLSLGADVAFELASDPPRA